jgi:hypothetical protein
VGVGEGKHHRVGRGLFAAADAGDDYRQEDGRDRLS